MSTAHQTIIDSYTDTEHIAVRAVRAVLGGERTDAALTEALDALAATLRREVDHNGELRQGSVSLSALERAEDAVAAAYRARARE
jgi:hypothetical protein